MVIEHGKWMVNLTEDYSQFFGTCNWYTFHFAKVEFENEANAGAYEFAVALLGLGLRIRWKHTET